MRTLFGLGDLLWDEGDVEAPTYRRERRRVRFLFRFYRHVVRYLAIVGLLAIIDWLTGGGWWVQWVALIWGAVLLLHFLNTFAFGWLLGPEAERRALEGRLRQRKKE